MRSHFLILSLFCIAFLSAQQRPSRVPATPHPIEITQPNGDKLTIRLHGDEWRNFRTTIDGFVIVQDQDGFFRYAKIDKNGNYVPSKMIANNIENRSKSEVKFLKNQIKKEKLFFKPNNTFLQ